jgi:hypothetical protein
MNWRKRIWWISASLALTIHGLLAWLPGTPISLWKTELLNDPVLVRSVTSKHLILEDGRTISLPWIKEIPRDNPLFLESIKDGIEVHENGEVYCRIWIDPMAPSIPLWQKRRVNLGVLAAVLFPAGLDDAQFDPRFWASFQHDHTNEHIRSYGNRERRLIGCHWSWLKGIQENLERNILKNPVGDSASPAEHARERQDSVR